MRIFRHLRRSLPLLLALGLACPPAQATWSIVVLNTRTREVVVAGATCIPNFGVMTPIGSVAVGLGGGASQAAVWHGGKVRIFNGLRAGQTPAEIHAVMLNDAPLPPNHQWGIVGLHGPPQTYSGVQNGPYAGGVAGIEGDLRYVIQGNVIAGAAVIDMAEEALLTSGGDLGERVMEAMVAAARQGGDGRCSCGMGGADACGTPPPGMTHSAYTSFIVIARLGDTDSVTCGQGNANCTNGDYYARLHNQGSAADPDPVARLMGQYDEWRQALAGRADHYMSEVYCIDQLVQADGLDFTDVDIALVDVEGVPVVTAGHTIVATAVEDPGVTISPVTDNGDGTYHLQVTGGLTPGPVRIELVVQDGVRDVRLYPDVEFEVVTPSELFANKLSLSAAGNGLLEFELFEPSRPAGAFHVLGSASGTSPGVPWGGLTLPLNQDRFLHFTALKAGGDHLPNTLAHLDGAGRASAWAMLPSAGLQELVGSRLSFVAYYPNGPEGISNLVEVEVLP